MSKTRILITDTTGVTGGHALNQLIVEEFELRAMVRSRDDRTQKLEQKGVEICIGDNSRFSDVRDALSGVDRADFLYPIKPGLVSATAQFAQAARDASVQYIDNMSQISTRSDAASQAALAHWLAERVLGSPVEIPFTYLSAKAATLQFPDQIRGV